MNFRDIYGFIKKNLLQTILFYLIGVALLFSLFLFQNSSKNPVYPIEFSFEVQQLSQNQAHAMAQDLNKLFAVNDTLELSKRFNINHDAVASIKFFSFNMTVYTGTHTAKVQVELENKTFISPIFESIITYFNSDKFLLGDIQLKNKLIKDQLESIARSEGKLKENSWGLVENSSEIKEGKSTFSAELTSVYLSSKKAELEEELYKNSGIKKLNEPIIPLYPKRGNKVVYFLFSNIIIFSLLFFRILLVKND